MISLLAFVSIFLAQSDSDTSARAAGAGGAAGGIIGLIVGVLMIAGMWKIFSKAGKPGWAAIVPFYNYVVLCQVAGRPGWWFFLLLICLPIFFIIICFDLAKRFGQGAGFAIGLILLPFVFFPVLGFGSAQYQGAPAPAPAAAA
jgi:hypothetical protein